MQGHYGYNMLQNKVLRGATAPCQYCCCACSVDAGFRDRCSKVQPSENLPKRGQTRVNGAVCSPHYSRKNQLNRQALEGEGLHAPVPQDNTPKLSTACLWHTWQRRCSLSE